jgi:4-hydroxybenzoate polyprenyltransferase
VRTTRRPREATGPGPDRGLPAEPGNAPASKPALFARLVKVEHSVYALPFAYAGAFLAAGGAPTWDQLVWITVAMVGARSAAMALNRLIDAELDARNPRTAMRELPAGRLGRREVWFFTVASVALLVLAAFQLSEPCRYLWPIPLAAFVLYPYAKRFTWFCHYALGLTLGLAPAAAWLAVTGRLTAVPWLLFIAVGLWVGGFDVIYAIFDVDFDRRNGLHSVPVAVGPQAALVVAAASHGATVAVLVAVGLLSGLPAVYWGGLVLVAALLAWPHVDIARRGLDHVGMSFMTVNGAVGLVYGAVVVIATLWPGA